MLVSDYATSSAWHRIPRGSAGTDNSPAADRSQRIEYRHGVPCIRGLIVSSSSGEEDPSGTAIDVYSYQSHASRYPPCPSADLHGYLQQLDPKLRLQIQALGASRLQMLWILIKETRLPLLAAGMAGFGAVISEVGASMMEGGNIPQQTRVLTTATVMEVGKGDFGLAMALSIILIALVFLVNFILTMNQQRSRTR